MKHEKGTDEEVDSFDDQLDTPDEVEDSINEEVESTDEEEDTSDEDYKLELKKKSNSKGSKAKSDRRYGKTHIGRERALSISLAMKNMVMLTQRVMENQSDVQHHLVEIQADDHDLLVNSDNKNDDMLGYEFEKYSDAEDVARTNHLDQKLVKRGITRLYKFHREYGKPGGIKIKETFYALNRVLGLHRVLFLSFLGDLIRENIGRANKDEEFLDDEIRSVGDKLKEANDKIKEGTLNLNDGIDAMTVVFGKEKGGYARGVRSGVTYKSERQQKYVLVKKLSTKMTEKDVLVKKLSNKMTETKGMLSQLMNQLAAQGVTPKAINNIDSSTYEVDGTQSSVVVGDKDARIQKKSNGLATSEKVMETMEPVKTARLKKMHKSRRNGSPDSQYVAHFDRPRNAFASGATIFTNMWAIIDNEKGIMTIDDGVLNHFYDVNKRNKVVAEEDLEDDEDWLDVFEVWVMKMAIQNMAQLYHLSLI
nr:hypothetical protein [Tanacetum cinerariifolium]